MFRWANRRVGLEPIWIAAAISLGLMLSNSASAQAPPTAQDVGVVTLTKQEVPRIYSLPGRAVAYQQVSIRPRVSGVIQKILYDPKVALNVGDPLFKLDDASYAAAIASADADVATAKANVSVSDAAYKRAVNLKGSGFTEAQVEEAKASLETDQAALKAANAALGFAKTQLSWTTITSPIKGMADISSVSVGDLVTNAQSDALTTVTRLDPIEVTMQESSTYVLEVRRDVEAGTLKLDTQLKANLVLGDRESFTSEGVFVAAGNSVSTTTGTMTLRFRFDNPDHKVLPGMFLRGDIEVGTVEAFLVPQLAAKRVNTGLLAAFVVDKDGKSKQVQFSDIGTYENNWVVDKGFVAGDQVIVDRLIAMRPGTLVNPIPAKINKEGLVEKTEPKDGAKK